MQAPRKHATSKRKAEASGAAHPDRVPLEVSHPHLKDFFRFLPALNKESDRGRVLISCSYLDEMLREIILAFLRNTKQSLQLVEGFNAPLGTFSARATAAYAMGLITSVEFRECEILRKIRNRFAHDVHASFTTQDIIDLCKNLTMSAQPYDKVVVDARGQYTTAAVALIMTWTNRPVYASRNRLLEQDWPN